LLWFCIDLINFVLKKVMDKKQLLLYCLFALIIQKLNGQGMSDILYQSENFTIFADRVQQGNFKAQAKNALHLVSDYQSPANAFFNPLLNFKFSINGKDNEMPVGVNHLLLLQTNEGEPIVVRAKFGVQTNKTIVHDQQVNVHANTTVRFELDMSPVFAAFEKDGFYIDAKGNKLYQSDYKGVWIAGGTSPLSWDFENLPGMDWLKMKETKEKGILACELTFNPARDKSNETKEKKIVSNLSAYPVFSSGMPLPDALYNLSLEEMLLNIRQDNTFMAGEKWDGVWTRDISYSILLSLAMIEPEIAMNSLMRKVKNNRIVQDTGTGGSWPCSTDRQTWALAAWEVYLTTGDEMWLKQAFEIIRNSIGDDLNVAFNQQTGLFYGESSFLDWRKQSYPEWMEPVDIFLSHTLGTNAVFYQTLQILSKMGKILKLKNNYLQLAEKLKESMNLNLWSAEKSRYGQYLYGKYYSSLSPRFEALGEALCILTGIAGTERSAEIIGNAPHMAFGIPTIYPQIPGIPPYHNQSNWPFVQAYWTWAAAKSGNTAVVEHGIASIYRQAALFLTNKENLVIENGDFNGTEINSDRQLWSVAGNLAIVYRILFGMEFLPDKLAFSPFVPKPFSGNLQLRNFKYRNAILDIQLTGFGSQIASFELDGKKLRQPHISSKLSGRHQLVIRLNNRLEKGRLNLVKNLVTPEVPELKLEGNNLIWNTVRGAKAFRIYKDGKEINQTAEKNYLLTEQNGTGEYQILSVDENGTTSFLSKPVRNIPENKIQILEAEMYAKPSEQKSAGFSGNGFVEFSLEENKTYLFEVNAPEPGEYLIEFRYANGSGPVNTDNKCGIRALYCNKTYAGAAVFPQRGTEEWSNWGISNPLRVKLVKGLNRFELKAENFTQNMNQEINRFYMDQILVIQSW
jgi:hypothetical protein